MGKIEIQGKVEKLELIQGNQKFLAGAIPIGDYRIRYQFSMRPMRVLEDMISIQENKTIIIYCDEQMMLCWL